jgi:hypothetical protein
MVAYPLGRRDGRGRDRKMLGGQNNRSSGTRRRTSRSSPAGPVVAALSPVHHMHATAVRVSAVLGVSLQRPFLLPTYLRIFIPNRSALQIAS